MSFNAALYEGDSVIHSVPRIGSPSSRTGIAGSVAEPETALEAEELAVAELKGWEILIGMIANALSSFGNWLERKAIQAQYRQVEKYLSRSSNLADLEDRIRNLERAKQMNWIDCAIR